MGRSELDPSLTIAAQLVSVLHIRVPDIIMFLNRVYWR